MSIRNQSTVAVDAGLLRYGAADAVLMRPRPPGAAPSRKLKFFVGEWTGLLFIVLSFLYIFAAPRALTGSGAIKAAMNRLMKMTIDIVGAVVGLVI